MHQRIEEGEMKPYVHSAGSIAHFQWNVDCSVGKGGTNNLIPDVSYIQWYYSLAAENPLTPADRQEIYKKVVVDGHCRGTDDDPLVVAITTHQRALNHFQIDGRISVATASGKVGPTAFFVLRLGARFANMFPQYWPRLDLIPRCPATVAQAVKAAIPHIG
jgi:hypothetical protein